MTGVKGKGEWEFTGRHMLLVMIAFFGVIVAVNVTMAVLAGTSWTGLVVKNSYVASQHFNEDLAEARRQAGRGWSARLSYAGKHFEFSLMDRAGFPVVIDDLRVSVGRPVTEAQDRTIALAHLGSGKYRAAVALAPGVWKVRIAGGAGDNAYRRDSRIKVSQEGAGQSLE